MNDARPIVHHIPVCPFSQRVEILLELKGRRDAVRFETVDITKPRPERLLRLTRGSTALPVVELPDGRVVKESLVILRYFEDTIPEPAVAQRDPYRRAVENMLIAMEGPFVATGYRYVMNQDPARREAFRDEMLGHYARLDDFLVEHGPAGPFLFEEFGLAEAVYAPIFMRFWFLDHYESFSLPDEPRFSRVRRWREACLAHPCAQQVSYEEIVTLYYDYSRGAGNGALLPGRTKSSFAFEPHWSKRPLPPRGKDREGASDEALGLLP